MAKVHLTERSLLDIQDIYAYSVKHWGKATAEKYLDNMQDALKFIGRHPRILKTKPEISDRFIAYQVESHWLICDLVGSDIYVLTVKHVSIDLMNRLKTLAPTLEEETKLLFEQLKKKK